MNAPAFNIIRHPLMTAYAIAVIIALSFNTKTFSAMVETVDGKIYNDVIITRQEADQITFKHSSGIAAIPYNEISSSDLPLFDYDRKAFSLAVQNRKLLAKKAADISKYVSASFELKINSATILGNGILANASKILRTTNSVEKTNSGTISRTHPRSGNVSIRPSGAQGSGIFLYESIQEIPLSELIYIPHATNLANLRSPWQGKAYDVGRFNCRMYDGSSKSFRVMTIIPELAYLRLPIINKHTINRINAPNIYHTYTSLTNLPLMLADANNSNLVLYINANKALSIQPQPIVNNCNNECSFYLSPGLAGKNTVSIRSGYFDQEYVINHETDILISNIRSDRDFLRCSFFLKNGLVNDTMLSFESVDKPGFFLRNSNGRVFLDNNIDGEFLRECTFNAIQCSNAADNANPQYIENNIVK